MWYQFLLGGTPVGVDCVYCTVVLGFELRGKRKNSIIAEVNRSYSIPYCINLKPIHHPPHLQYFVFYGISRDVRFECGYVASMSCLSAILAASAAACAIAQAAMAHWRRLVASLRLGLPSDWQKDSAAADAHCTDSLSTYLANRFQG